MDLELAEAMGACTTDGSPARPSAAARQSGAGRSTTAQSVAASLIDAICRDAVESQTLAISLDRLGVSKGGHAMERRSRRAAAIQKSRSRGVSPTAVTAAAIASRHSTGRSGRVPSSSSQRARDGDEAPSGHGPAASSSSSSSPSSSPHAAVEVALEKQHHERRHPMHTPNRPRPPHPTPERGMVPRECADGRGGRRRRDDGMPYII